VKAFVAFDGQEFGTAKACREHEKLFSGDALVGLTAVDVAAAMDGSNPQLGDAIERFTREIAKARIERGGRKRAPKAKDEPAPAQDAAPTEPEPTTTAMPDPDAFEDEAA